MLLTTEEAKRRILDYLEAQVEGWDGSDIRPFTQDAIEGAVDSEAPRIASKALDALQEEGNVEAVAVQVKVFVPVTQQGRNVGRGIAESGHRIGSAFGAMFVSLVLIYAAGTMFPLVQPEQPAAGIQDAYFIGFEYALIMAVIIGFPTAWLLHAAWSRYKKWTMAQTSAHVEIVAFTKKAILVAAAGLVAYFAWSASQGQSVLPSVVATIVVGAVSITAIYHRMRANADEPTGG